MLWGSRPCPRASAAASVAGWTAGTAGDFCRHGPMPPGLSAKPEHTHPAPQLKPLLASCGDRQARTVPLASCSFCPAMAAAAAASTGAFVAAQCAARRADAVQRGAWGGPGALPLARRQGAACRCPGAPCKCQCLAYNACLTMQGSPARGGALISGDTALLELQPTALHSRRAPLRRPTLPCTPACHPFSACSQWQWAGRCPGSERRCG